MLQSSCMEFPKIVVSAAMPEGELYLLGIRTRPVVFGLGEDQLELVERLERGIDWEATARASAVVKGIGA